MKIYIPLLLIIAVTTASAQTLTAERIHPSEIQIGGEIGRRIDITIDNNLMKIDLDNDFLKPFREKTGQTPYIGLGKLIDSFVRFAAYRNDPNLIERKDYVIEETIKTQEPDGYIGTFPPQNRMWPLWDIHEMSYLTNGLVSDYHFFKNKDSLKAAQNLMDYIIKRWRENPDGMKDCPIEVFVGVTGLEEALLMLYHETGEKRYLDFCVDFRQLPQWDYPLVLGRWGPIGGHAYAYMQRCLSQLRLYNIQPDPNLLSQSRNVLDFLLNRDGYIINGVCSQHECWHNTQDVTAGLGETCSTAYLIRLLDESFRMEPKTIYGDMMERTVMNGLFSAQSPDGRKLRYYVPLEGKREYFDRDTYCCPCNYRRIVAELPTMVYYAMNRGIAANLYTPSQLKHQLPDGTELRIKQETDYPSGDLVTFSLGLDLPSEFPFYVRIPRWCDGASIHVYSKNESNPLFSMRSEGGHFATIEREWNGGDIVRLNLPMRWRFIKGRQAQAGRVAVMYGPTLFSLNPDVNPDTQDIDLREIVIDPQTIEGPFPDDTVHPNGMACTIKGWKELGFSRGGNHNLTLRLTESTDPNLRATYFRVRKLDQTGENDELISVGKLKTSQ